MPEIQAARVDFRKPLGPISARGEMDCFAPLPCAKRFAFVAGNDGCGQNSNLSRAAFGLNLSLSPRHRAGAAMASDR
jgi:hypothetical protein